MQEYEILATLDSKTSPICREQDGKRYKVGEEVVGENCPPFHPWCRTVTIPVVEGVGAGERAAWNAESGKSELVPGDMTYGEWKRGVEDSRNKPLLTNALGKRIIGVDKTTPYGEPNTITQVINSKGGIDRNYYGDDSRQIKQISNNGHGHKTAEAFGIYGEHMHDYIWNSDGSFSRPMRELTEEERKENADIL